MAAITNNNERWNGHTYVEIENFVKSKLDQIPSTESIDSVVQGKLTTELRGYAPIGSIELINERIDNISTSGSNTDLTNYVNKDQFDTAIDDLSNSINDLQVEVNKFIKSITYGELKLLKDGGNLTPGKQYRITDYEYTPNVENEYINPISISSANHPFDIIVTADSPYSINENARAIQHTTLATDYFFNSNLAAWELKYVLDTDPQLGKGTITWMKDEWNNECHYDFKNALFERDGVYYYTFSHVDDNEITDDSKDVINAGSKNNKLGQQSFNNVFYGKALDNILKYACENNTFGNECNNNTLENFCNNNTFGYECNNNTFGYDCDYNTFGNSCNNNTFENFCGGNTFGNECNNNTFGTECSNNTFGDFCYRNTFGDFCRNNTFENFCGGNTFGNHFRNNSLGFASDDNTFGNDCHHNVIGTYAYINYFENDCSYNTTGGYCSHITFYHNCTHITFGDYNYVKSYYDYITFDGNNSFIYLNCNATTGFNTPYKNVRINYNLKGTEDNPLIIEDNNINQAFSTLFTSDDFGNIRKLINYYVDPNSGDGDGYGPNMDEYVTETELNNILQDYAKVTDIPTGSDYGYGLNLSEYVTETELYHRLSNYAEKSEIPSLEGYATQEWVNSQLLNISSGNYDIDLSDYVTETELQTYALKTDIPSLEGYATEAWVNSKLSNISSNSPVSEYIYACFDSPLGNSNYPEDDSEKEDLFNDVKTSNSGYASYNGTEWYSYPQGISAEHKNEYIFTRYKSNENDVEWSYAAAPVLWAHWGDGNGYDYIQDISEYVDETELNNTLQEYALKSEIPDVSNFAEKSEIPSLEGYATEAWVSSQLSNLPSGNYDVDFSEFVTETELNVVKNLKEVTYNELVTLRNSNKLVPGMQYRITDYDCNLVDGGDDSSAGNQFDIIVTADSSNSINEKARAIQHTGDTYFSNSNLAAWELKYTLDTNLFYSTDKGTITYMKDEFNNECYYDFKNILVDNRFTFDYEYSDYSLNGNCHDNKIGYNSTRNIFINQYDSTCAYNILGDNCINNIFGSNCEGNVFGNVCCDNNFSDDCTYNVLNPHCNNNSFGTGCTGNTLGLNCNHIDFSTNYRYIIVENGNQYIYLDCPNAGGNDYYQNVKISLGFNNTSTLENIRDENVNQDYQTVYPLTNTTDNEMISGE